MFVTDEYLLGEPDQAWKMLLPTLNNERIMLSSFCVGILDGVLEDALAYAQQCEAFGHKIGEFTLFGSDINDGPLLAESQIELHRPLAAWRGRNRHRP